MYLKTTIKRKTNEKIRSISRGTVWLIAGVCSTINPSSNNINSYIAITYIVFDLG